MLNRVSTLYKRGGRFLFEGNTAFYIFLLFLLALFSRGFPDVALVYNVIPIFLVIYFFFGAGQLNQAIQLKRIIFLIIVFTFWVTLSSLWSMFPIFSLKRSAYFLLISLGSLLIGYRLNKLNKYLILKSFRVLNLLLVFITALSLIFNVPANSWTGGHGLGFLGFTNHQNKLGQYIFLSSAPLILFFTQKLEQKGKYLVSILLISNIVILALTVSRASILALFIVWVIYFLLNYSFAKSILFSLAFFGIITSTIFISTNFFNKKQITIVKHESSFGERRYKTIIDSWDSALNGGVFGLGYGISDERFDNPKLGYVDKTSEGEIYRREKTISILAIIEEVGIVGLALFLLVIGYPLKIFWEMINKVKKEEKENWSRGKKSQISNLKSQILYFTFAFLISLNVYAQIESWWIGIGSAVMPVYFIYVGAVIKGSEIIKVNSNG